MSFRNIIIVSFTLSLISCNRETQDDPFLSREEAQQKIDNIIDNIEEPQIPSDTIDIIEFSGHAPDTEGTFNFQPLIKFSFLITH